MTTRTMVLKKIFISSILFSLAIQNGYAKDVELKNNESKKIQSTSKTISEDEIKKQLKANIHTFQVMLETYAVIYKGIYPENISALIKDAKNNPPYYKNLKNPFGEKLDGLVDKKSNIKGAVVYEPIKDSKGNITIYKIFGNDKTGHHLKNDSGEDFCLSNV